MSLLALGNHACYGIIPQMAKRRLGRLDFSELDLKTFSKYWSSHLEINLITDSTLGAIGELIVATDLMSKGYEVFRALSPASPIDLIALKLGGYLPLQVRTGRYNKQGIVIYSKKDYEDNNTRYAIITYSDSKIHYIPSLD